ncbi:YebC/PmpR family DNA-binding transcriptional regulator [filamentous cyanobacterium LEGE 11480]|uniref:Probable transcriptional regulatory protein IQ266_17335 n=1 Tax=Romeriopsis navalis LEGE 11480 TaxID=2777977 RepID=A0A928VMT7_9CYAN|nr:YebC/PmpR family DNA-binding transcriptional regulator [Romeriopsis navalis]MBE9031498.1 YebC/PmpR family DNA-binding transcriptional regulator [Romeriopsis navalis LEGE 11480]
MSGHSKWATIKRQKARVDAKRANVFTKIAREIIVAARQGADPLGNFQLRTAIDKAKAAGIPNDNIDRAIAKGAGTWSDGESLEAMRYEGYGPGGVALVIEALTDNRNRTAADLRTAFSKNGGNLGEMGCVSFMFEQKGVVEVTFDLTPTGRGRSKTVAMIDEDALLEACLEGGAETYELSEIDNGKVAEIVTDMANLENLSQALRARDYQVTGAEFRWIPQTTVEVTDLGLGQSLIKLIDVIDELDDVQSVTPNFAMSDDLMAAIT